MVEDEKYLAKAIAEILKKNYYTVDIAHDGELGLELALSGIYDIFIFDIMLPKRDGLSLLKAVRKQGIQTPVILLTARAEVEDKVLGLDLGADDYLPKPFHNAELLARLRALSRRQETLQIDGILTFGDLKLSPHTLMLNGDHGEVKLTLKEAGILEMLIQNKNRILSKERMIEKIWGYDADVGDNHVEAHISLIRKKLGQIKSAVKIKTIRGAGYTLFEGDDLNESSF